MTAAARAPADLVLQGGGVKGIALAGAAEVLMRNYEIRRVAGTSAGAILASLVAAGYTGDEVGQAMRALPYAEVPDSGAPVVPVLSPLASLFAADGLYRGDVIENWVRDRLAAKGVHTFADLALDDDEGADPYLEHDDRAFRLVVTATDITRGRGLRLPWDYQAAFGLEPREQSVAAAVRMSLSIPLFFVPRALTDTRTGETSTIVDGGVMTNFPVELFDRQDGQPPRWPTFGIGVIPDLPGGDRTLLPLPAILGRLPGPLPILEATVATAISGHDQTYLGQPRNAARVVRIDTSAVGVVDFDLGPQQRDGLVENGLAEASAFLSSWDWDDYLARFYPTRMPRRSR